MIPRSVEWKQRNGLIPLYKEPYHMKNKLYYLLALTAITVGLFGKVDIRQSPPDPTCPFDQWPCTSAK